MGIPLATLVFAAWCGAVFTWLERVWPRRKTRADLRVIAIGMVLLAVNAGVTRLLATTAGAATLARVFAAWVVSELLLYALHRAQHGVAWLWRFHRFHHASAELTWARAWHVHPIDAALFAGASACASWLVGAPLPSAAVFVVFRRAWTVVLHANIAWPATALDRWVATPSFHHRHHRESEPVANFAATLALLDVVFGTFKR